MSDRIQQLIRMVKAWDRVIDVGCDHGQMSIGLAQRKDIGSVLATDISGPSLQKLIDRLEACLEEDWAKKIQTFHTDGLKNLPWSKAGAILIAGMGGELMVKILEANPTLVANTEQLVLSHHLDAAKVRAYLTANSFAIVDEHLLEENGHYYEMISARRRKAGESEQVLSEVALQYGPILIARRDPLLHKKLQEDRDKLLDLIRNLEKLDDQSKVSDRLAVLRDRQKGIVALLNDEEGKTTDVN